MVRALGFRGDMVQDFGDYVLIEGDIRFTKAELRAGRPSLIPGRRLQYSTTNLVSSSKVHQITVDVSGLSSQSGWQTAVRDAMTQWNGISNSYVYMTEVTGTADITVATTCTSSNVAAFASFPSGGNPGATVYVNTCFAYSTTSAQKLHNMVHELGHTLGFRHSNYTQMGETAGTEGAVLISGAPTSGNATGSVMNGGTALNSWAGFATSDLTAVRSLYPLPFPATMTVTESGGYPLVSWSAVSGAISYTVNLFTQEGEESGVYNYSYSTLLVSGTTATSYLDTSHTWTGVYECYDENWLGRHSHMYEYEVVSTFANGTSSRFSYAPIANYYCL